MQVDAKKIFFTIKDLIKAMQPEELEIVIETLEEIKNEQSKEA